MKAAFELEVGRIYQAILAGKGKPVAVPHGMSCARVYVCVGHSMSAAVAKAAKKAGMIFQKKAHYGYSHALYAGYDTGSGAQAAIGHGIVLALEAIGVPAYLEFGED